MARYSKIERRILTDQKFNSLSRDGKLIFFILLVHPHLTAIGAMRATLAGLASEMKWPYEDFQQAFAEVLAKGMVKYDEDASLIWIPKYLDHNQPESPNVVKSWGQCLDYLTECALKNEIIQQTKTFVASLSASFQEALPEAFLKPSPSLSKGLPESVTVTVTEAVTGTGTVAVTDNIVAPARPCARENDSLNVIFTHWKTIFHHPNAVLDEKRKKLIRNALKNGYSETQLIDAITGCSYTPHNMGDNDRGQRYDGLHVILRDADQIDRFIHNAHNPPKPPNAADQLLAVNRLAAQNWLQQHHGEPVVCS